MNELELPGLIEVAARACINQRCALAYLHDVRGSMQALFSAVELLGRSARAAAASQERIEKACDLARRAIGQHERLTLGALAALTLQPAVPESIDFGPFVQEAAHFLRNDASSKDVTLQVNPTAPGVLHVSAARAKLHSLVVGLIAAAVDAVARGATLTVTVARVGAQAVMTIGSAAAYVGVDSTPTAAALQGPVAPNQLTFWFAQHFLTAQGGHLELDAAADTMRVSYPADA